MNKSFGKVQYGSEFQSSKDGFDMRWKMSNKGFVDKSVSVVMMTNKLFVSVVQNEALTFCIVSSNRV